MSENRRNASDGCTSGALLTTLAVEVSDEMAASHSTGKSPAFQFYPKDFLTDEKVRVMSLQERGAYITLMCLCWTEGTIPSDLLRLARLCEVPVRVFRHLWPALEPCFQGARGAADSAPARARAKETSGPSRRALGRRETWGGKAMAEPSSECDFL